MPNSSKAHPVEDEQKLIHLALKNRACLQEIKDELPAERFDAVHQPLVKAIYEQYEDSGGRRLLTRDSYRQWIQQSSRRSDLMHLLRVYDKCFIKAFARPDDLGHLKKRAEDGFAARGAQAALEKFRKSLDGGYTAALKGLVDGLSTTLAAVDRKGHDLEIVTLADVEIEEVEWLWDSRIARGKLTMFIGEPESGKSFASLSLAARLSKGMPLPNATTSCVTGDTLILSSEDGLADTITPRFLKQGGDLSRVHFIQGHKDGTMFSLASDIPTLERALARYPDTRMIVIDPLNAYLGVDTDSHRDSDVRRILSPLCDFADRTKVAVVGIMHLTKDNRKTAINRASGSIGFIAASRAAWLFAKDRDDPSRYLMLHVKNNLAKDPGGLAFRISDDLGVEWELDTVTVTANEALAANAMPRAQAIEWLETILDDGPMPSKDVFDLADRQGISKATLKRAKNELQVKARQVTDHWQWELPESAKSHENKLVLGQEDATW